MKMAWRNPCRFFMQQKQSKANSEKTGKPEKVTFHTPWLQKSACPVTKRCVLVRRNNVP